MSQTTTRHFAQITPVDRQHAGRVLNTWNLVWYNLLVLAFLVTFGVTWCLFFAVAGFLFAVVAGASALVSAASAIVMVLVGYFSLLLLCFGFAYPEWPLNRVLCRKLLRSVTLRENSLNLQLNSQIRVVELVPRNRWNKKLYLDTATDLMTIQVDERGVWMHGDFHRYDLPADSILGVELVDARPPGSPPTFRVILYLRTETGTIELPVSYRDYRWGSLRNSRRQLQAESLAQQISTIAKGHLHQPLQSPFVAPSPRTASWSANPYAAPASI